jgi:hypothetical protein
MTCVRVPTDQSGFSLAKWARPAHNVGTGLVDRLSLSLPAFLPALLHRESSELSSFRTAGRRTAGGVLTQVGGMPKLGDHRDEASVNHLCIERERSARFSPHSRGQQLKRTCVAGSGSVATSFVSLLERISTTSDIRTHTRLRLCRRKHGGDKAGDQPSYPHVVQVPFSRGDSPIKLMARFSNVRRSPYSSIEV